MLTMRALVTMLLIISSTNLANADVKIPKRFDFAGVNLVQFSEGSLGIQVNLTTKTPLHDENLTDSDRDELKENMFALCWLYMPKVFEEIEKTNDRRNFTHGIVSVTWRKAGVGNLAFVDQGWRSVFKLDGNRCGEGV